MTATEEIPAVGQRVRSLRIVVIADAFVPVPPAGYGGTERIVDLMCRCLVRSGHRVHLVAAAGSRDYGAGVTTHRPPSSAYASRVARKLWFQALAGRATFGADLVINHGRLDYLEFLFRTRTPAVHWFHTPLTGAEVEFVRRRRKEGDHFIGVSRSQVTSHPQGARFTVVPNAIDAVAIPYTAQATQPPYVVFLGRLTRQKGVHLAIAAARRAGVRLVIGGNVSNERDAAGYFAAEIKPHLGPQCEWVGPYDEAQRIALLRGASALLFPIQGPEAFGLVMIEAMAGGVPVIATRHASTPEVVEHGRTGFLCDGVEGMAAAIHRVPEISRAECRAAAERQFGLAAFGRNLDDLLAHVMATR